MRRCLARALPFLLAFSAGAAAPEPTEHDLVGYLRHNRQGLPTDGSPAELPPGFIPTAGRRIFLLGEVHGFAVNNAVDLSLLKYLHRAAGVRTYLSEISFAHAWYLNCYLERGDIASLDLVFRQWKGRTVDATKEKRRFWEEMRQWNEGLPPAARIAIAGVDLERFPGISLAYIRMLVGGAGVPPYLKTAADDLLRLPADASPGQMEKAADQLAIVILTSHSECSTAMGEEWLFGLERAVRNLQDRGRAGAEHGPAFDEVRDRAMFANLRAISGRLPDGSIYGRIGFAHVLQHPWIGVHWLSSYLNGPDSPWAGRVVGIWPLYRESHRLALLPAHHFQAIDGSDDPRLTAPFARVAQGENTLFRLNGPGSPFGRLLWIPPEAKEGVTTDYFQYALLMKQAKPATPW